MSKLTEKSAPLLHRQRSVTREYAAEIANWVGEGGAADPTGPPRVVDEHETVVRSADSGYSEGTPRR